MKGNTESELIRNEKQKRNTRYGKKKVRGSTQNKLQIGAERHREIDRKEVRRMGS